MHPAAPWHLNRSFGDEGVAVTLGFRNIAQRGIVCHKRDVWFTFISRLKPGAPVQAKACGPLGSAGGEVGGGVEGEDEIDEEFDAGFEVVEV